MLNTIHRITLLLLLFSFVGFVSAQDNPEQAAKAEMQRQRRIEKNQRKILKQKEETEKQRIKAQADEARQKKKAQKSREDFLMYKTPGTIYVFGVSQTLGTSQFFVTDITAVDSLALQKKTKFLPFRSSFSLQFQQYTEGQLGQTRQTASVFFSTNKNKLQKKLDKVKRRVLAQQGSTLTLVTSDQFHFVHPLDLTAKGKSE